MSWRNRIRRWRFERACRLMVKSTLHWLLETNSEQYVELCARRGGRRSS